MSVNEAIVGKEYPAAAPYEVGREKIREFAQAVGARSAVHTDPAAAVALGYADVIAPPTFAVIPAQRCEFALIADGDAGIDFSMVVHGEEKFVHHRPIQAGDRLIGTLRVDSVRKAGGHAMVTTTVALVTESGEPVSDVTSTIVVRGGGE